MWHWILKDRKWQLGLELELVCLIWQWSFPHKGTFQEISELQPGVINYVSSPKMSIQLTSSQHDEGTGDLFISMSEPRAREWIYHLIQWTTWRCCDLQRQRRHHSLLQSRKIGYRKNAVGLFLTLMHDLLPQIKFQDLSLHCKKKKKKKNFLIKWLHCGFLWLHLYSSVIHV